MVENAYATFDEDSASEFQYELRFVSSCFCNLDFFVLVDGMSRMTSMQSVSTGGSSGGLSLLVSVSVESILVAGVIV